MMKRLLFLALITLCYSSVSFAQKTDAPAPEFTGKLITGEKFDLNDSKGEVVVLDFWASWCGPCREEMPFLARLQRAYRDDGVRVLAINVDTDARSMHAFLQDLGIALPFPILPDPEGSIPSLFEIKGMPTTVFIDTAGVIRFQHAGFRKSDENAYQDALVSLIHERVTETH